MIYVMRYKPYMSNSFLNTLPVSKVEMLLLPAVCRTIVNKLMSTTKQEKLTTDSDSSVGEGKKSCKLKQMQSFNRNT